MSCSPSAASRLCDCSPLSAAAVTGLAPSQSTSAVTRSCSTRSPSSVDCRYASLWRRRVYVCGRVACRADEASVHDLMRECCRYPICSGSWRCAFKAKQASTLEDSPRSGVSSSRSTLWCPLCLSVPSPLCRSRGCSQGVVVMSVMPSHVMPSRVMPSRVLPSRVMPSRVMSSRVMPSCVSTRRSVLQPQYKLFRQTPSRRGYFEVHPFAASSPKGLRCMHLIGRCGSVSCVVGSDHPR